MAVGQRYIIVGDSAEYIPVIDAYAYTYDAGVGKTVLRVKIKADEKSFEELETLFAEDTIIEEYEDKEHPTMKEGTPDSSAVEIVTERTFVFEHFCKDFKCDYNSTEDIYEIEVTRKTDEEIAIEATQDQTIDAYAAVAEIYEM